MVAGNIGAVEARFAQLNLAKKEPAISLVVLYHCLDSMEVDILNGLTADVVARVGIGN
jgi:hypothetical protein